MAEGSYRAQYGLKAYLSRFVSVATVATAIGIVWIAVAFIFADFRFPEQDAGKTFSIAMSLYLLWGAAFFGNVYGQYLSPAATNGQSDSYFFLHIFLTWCWAAIVAGLAWLLTDALWHDRFIPFWFFGFAYVLMCPLFAVMTAHNVSSNHMYFFGYSSPTLLFGNDPDFLADLRLAYEERRGKNPFRFW